MKASARVSGLELPTTDETNVSTPQSPTQTHARLSGSNGYAGWPKCAEAAPREGPQTAGDSDPTEATRIKGAVSPRSQFAFSAADRLHRRQEFLRIQRLGARLQTDLFVIYAAQFSESARVRLGVTVSRRLGKAVIRNRVKRRIREAFRTKLRSKLPGGTELVVIARNPAGRASMDCVAKELNYAVAKLRPHLKKYG